MCLKCLGKASLRFFCPLLSSVITGSRGEDSPTPGSALWTVDLILHRVWPQALTGILSNYFQSSTTRQTGCCRLHRDPRGEELLEILQSSAFIFKTCISGLEGNLDKILYGLLWYLIGIVFNLSDCQGGLITKTL